MSIDLSRENLVPLKKAAGLIPGVPHPNTLRRWQHEGLRGVHLETLLVGGRCFTSHEALARFIERTNAARRPVLCAASSSKTI
jgi:hypothetical protein